MSSDRLQQLWAPWRLSYVAAEPQADRPDCFICDGLSQSDDRRHLIVQRTEHSVVVLNKYPYNNGHLLVAPLRHVARPQDLHQAEVLDQQQQLQKMMERLNQLIKPEGYNIGMNLGRVSGAGLPGHLHWHLVPRWNGDTNFMPVLADTKVIAQSLEALYDLLHDVK